ncbi:Domain of uncharacterised function (DUF2825) [Escherichia coli]|nr:Domain of uncharacterised function (DUF2825) [Escherichia coli]SQY95358.1 Domain of uncharacterised function (DUF2825) [Escherichia coli]
MKKIRFIPAGAGNTRPCNRNGDFNSVYPRWRGEHCWMSLSNTERSGLSPLARGTLNIDRAVDKVIRFIPAGAGNTLVLNRPALETPVYPRWRGEHGNITNKINVNLGLSPLARGTRKPPRRWLAVCRFIPAGAGNTLLPAQNRRFASVYPRWRGEHSASVQAGTRYSGLSPLARGTRGFFISAPRSARFIPAGAGNTCHEHIATR